MTVLHNDNGPCQRAATCDVSCATGFASGVLVLELKNNKGTGEASGTLS